MTRLRRPRLLILLVLIVGFAVGGAPAPTLHAQTVDTDGTLERALGAERDGEVTAAAALFVEVVTAPEVPVDTLAEAWVGLARTAFNDGQPRRAAALALAGLREIPADHIRRAELLYLRGVGLRDAGQAAGAALALRRVVAGGGVLAPIARLRLGQVLVLDGRSIEAVPPYQLAANDRALAPALREVARAEGADILFDLDRPDDAIALLELTAQDPAAAADARARAYWAIALARLEDDDPAWAANARAVVELAPGTVAAGEALAALEVAGEPVPALSAAYVQYLAQLDDAARARYTSILTNAPTSDEAHVASFYIGAIDERAGATDAAVASYDASIEAAPGGYLADDALWWSAVILEGQGDVAEAADRYARLLEEYPASEFAAAAAMRGPLALVEAGDATAGIEALQTVVATAEERSDGATAAEAARWLQLLGVEGAPAPEALGTGTLWALLATAGGDARRPLPAGAVLETPGLSTRVLAERSEAQLETNTWLAQRSGQPLVAPGESRVATDPRLGVLQALAEVGEVGAARSIAFDLLEAYRTDDLELIAVARAASDVGLFDASIAAAEVVLGSVPAAERCAAPGELLRLAYPVEFAGELTRAADLEAIPPLLLAALVRQESRFNQRAGSVAGAAGLTQVIAPTGEAIAASLGVGWDPLDLYRPATSLRFGAHYFGTQLEDFDGDVFAALAAYNGGPGNALRWQQEQRFPGADGFVHAVDFPETRSYLELVLENYGWYRCIYAGEPEPSLR
ncbi:MAG: transglycosylase SLT domain-containing protein [Dehalococcoidia bacterium]